MLSVIKISLDDHVFVCQNALCSIFCIGKKSWLKFKDKAEDTPKKYRKLLKNENLISKCRQELEYCWNILVRSKVNRMRLNFVREVTVIGIRESDKVHV